MVAWPQDYSYWTWTKPQAHLTCWIGLDPTDADRGCLWYVPGSHRWGLKPITALAGDMDAVLEVLSPEEKAQMERKTPVEMARGRASFHHSLMMHGSYENRSGDPRRGTVINVFKDYIPSLYMP